MQNRCALESTLTIISNSNLSDLELIFATANREGGRPALATLLSRRRYKIWAIEEDVRVHVIDAGSICGQCSKR
jgi:hypothetical protein